MFSKVKAVLIDLSGTLHIETTVTPNAIPALQRLRDARLPIRFVTNTTKTSKTALVRQLNTMGGLHIVERAAKTHLQKNGLRPLLMLEKEAEEDFVDIEKVNPNAVVVGLAPSLFSYDPLTDAMNVLLGGGELIAIHKGRYFQKKDGLALGPGPFVAALEYATDKKAFVVGKPNPNFFKMALEEMNVTAEEAVMIGDDVRDDVGGAMAIGMQGILVKTGKYREADEFSKGVTPTLVASSFHDAVEAILSSIKA
ncbi:haloacid dehalogenase-like hydrolase domain-containing 2-like protein [Chytridium lagenaria]|nr:haloacid dehalogenase-like hydrolase domain-containing 2-like protein [Chytridium lagenaria]